MSKFVPSFDYAAELGTTHGLHLDVDFENISSKTDEIFNKLSDIRRSDGKLNDSLVDVYNLSRDVLNLIGGLIYKGLWSTATSYAVNDVIDNAGYVYVCKTAHASSALFATDSAKWVRFGFGPSAQAQITADTALNTITAHLLATIAAHPASAISYAGGPSLSAGSVESALDALDAGKANAANAALTGTPTAPTATNGSANTQIANTAFVSSAVAAVASGGETIVSLGAIFNSSIAKSSSDTVGITQKGKAFICTANLTLSPIAAVSLGDGFAFAVIPNTGVTVTIDPNGSELIDGAASKAFNKVAIIYCNGSSFYSLSTADSVAFATNATNATYATSAGNADTVDGQHASAFAAVGHGHSYAGLNAIVSVSGVPNENGYLVGINIVRANGATT